MEFINRISEAGNLDQIISELLMNVEGDFDLGILYVCPWTPYDPMALSQVLKTKGHMRHLICCTCAGIIGGEQEIEGRPSASLMLMRLPHVKIVPFAISQPVLETISGMLKASGLLRSHGRFTSTIISPVAVSKKVPPSSASFGSI